MDTHQSNVKNVFSSDEITIGRDPAERISGQTFHSHHVVVNIF